MPFPTIPSARPTSGRRFLRELRARHNSLCGSVFKGGTTNVNRLHTSLFALGAGMALMASSTPLRPSVVFEKQPRMLYTGRSPKFVTGGPQGLGLLSVKPGSDSHGFDLFLQSSLGAGDVFGAPVRVNNAPGEVSDHGENSPQIVASPDQRFFYAAW